MVALSGNYGGITVPLIPIRRPIMPLERGPMMSGLFGKSALNWQARRCELKRGGMEKRVNLFHHSLDMDAIAVAEESDVIPGLIDATNGAGGLCGFGTSLTLCEDGGGGVHYTGGCRWRVLELHNGADGFDHAFPTHARVELMRDEPAPEKNLRQLEWELYDMGSVLIKLMEKCGHEVQYADTFFAFAPPMENTVSSYLQDHSDIVAWSSQHRRKKQAPSSIQRRRTMVASAFSPYTHVSGQIGQEWRQELFSFACAHLLDLSPVEKLALCLINDTCARQAWLIDRMKVDIGRSSAEAQLRDALGNHPH